MEGKCYDGENDYRCIGSDCVIVFIHGISEGTSQFHDWALSLSKNYSVYCLMLPGHGGSGESFSKSTMQDWENYVFKRIISLSRKYRRVLVVGHSLGALLAIEAAIELRDCVSALFLIATPLKIRLKPAGLFYGYLATRGLRWQGSHYEAALRTYSVREERVAGYVSWLPNYARLYIKSRELRASTLKLDCPITAIQASHDEFVSPRSGEYLRKAPSCRVVRLKRSGHVYYDFAEREAMLRLICIAAKNAPRLR